MKNLKIIATLILLVAITACENTSINPSSNITIQDRTVENYTGIEISTVFEVDITYSDSGEKIEIEANENLHAHIDVLKDGSDLVIKLKDNTNITGKSTLKAHITTGYSLEKISVRDASGLIMNNQMPTDDVLLALSDASFLSANVAANSALVRIEGASRMDLAGSCKDMDLFIYDASELNALDMAVDNIVAEMEGAAKVKITVNETINLTAKDASVFNWQGDAVITDIDLQDAAEINKLD